MCQFEKIETERQRNFEGSPETEPEEIWTNEDEEESIIAEIIEVEEAEKEIFANILNIALDLNKLRGDRGVK